MNMTGRFLRFFLLFVSVLVCVSMEAQTGAAYGAYSPYSVFGVGDLNKEGTAFNRSMGGVGIANRTRRFINYTNPAAISAIDSSSFMADFGVVENNVVFDQSLDGNRLRSGSNTFNIYNFIMAFPVYRTSGLTSAMMVGISPFSDVGYDFSNNVTSPDIIGVTNNIRHTHYGEGSVYQLFAGASATLWKRLAVGAEFIYYFGTLDRASGTDFTDASIRDITAGSEMLVRAVTGKFGVQYEQPLGSSLMLTLGATYRMKTNMRGTTTSYQYAELSGIRDTISYRAVDNRSGLSIGDELGVGVSLRSGERWSVEFNYLRSDWRSSGMDNSSLTGFVTEGFTSSVSQSFRAGFEIVPNRNDIRYYLRRCAYRAGVYYDQSYYMFNGNRVDAAGITLGVTLPVFRLYNGISIGVDLGQRGSMRNMMVRERYATISVGFNIHDLWFHKPRYE